MIPHSIDTEPASSWQLALVRDLKTGAVEGVRDVVDFVGTKLGHVEPLRHRHRDDSEIIDLFVRWRNQNRTGWLDQRLVTAASTRQWLGDVLDDPLRLNMLFYIDGRLAGRGGARDLHRFGYSSDGLVRGGRGGGLWFMHFVNFACMTWDFEQLDLRYIDSLVLAGNELAEHAVRLLGYEVVATQQLIRQDSNNGIRWVPATGGAGTPVSSRVETNSEPFTSGAANRDSASQRVLLRLRVTREAFFAAKEEAWRRQQFQWYGVESCLENATTRGASRST